MTSQPRDRWVRNREVTCRIFTHLQPNSMSSLGQTTHEKMVGLYIYIYTGQTVAMWFKYNLKSGLLHLFFKSGIYLLWSQCQMTFSFFSLHRFCSLKAHIFPFADFSLWVNPHISRNESLWVITARAALSFTLPLGLDHIRVPKNLAPKQKPTHARKNAQMFCHPAPQFAQLVLITIWCAVTLKMPSSKNIPHN